MTDTERIAHRVYDRHAALHECATIGCLNLCAGSRYCTRCLEEINGEPYPLRNLLLSRPHSWLRHSTIICGLILFIWLLAIIFGW